MYVTVTGLGIAYAVELVSQFMHKPREIFWKAALRILAYIKGSPSKCLLYKSIAICEFLSFLDSNYVGDKRDRKSTSDYYTMLETIWLLEGVRSRVLCLIPVLKLSIEQ